MLHDDTNIKLQSSVGSFLGAESLEPTSMAADFSSAAYYFMSSDKLFSIVCLSSIDKTGTFIVMNS